MKTRLFLDTNVIIDLLGERDPYYLEIAKITTLADLNEIELVVSALSYSTVYYILSKYDSNENVKNKLRKFKILANISDLNTEVIEKNLSSNFKDFEDGLQYHCAIQSACNILITRNHKDFKNSQIPVMNANEYLRSIGRH